ncbi:MAG: hypothetical protein GXO89_06045 [Chlorobi bacterium]|nr:hypothetical protein [Chlorobiota bacterium]
MKKLILLISITISLSTLAQENNNFSVDLGLVNTHKGFFYLYQGMVDINIGYNLKLWKGLYAGGAFQTEYLRLKNTQARTLIFKPKVNLHYYINFSKKLSLVPWISVGYSFLQIKNKEFGYSDNVAGLNLSPELKFVRKTNSRVNYYIFGRYDYVYLKEDPGFTQLEYFRNVHISSFGIGVFIKPKK